MERITSSPRRPRARRSSGCASSRSVRGISLRGSSAPTALLQLLQLTEADGNRTRQTELLGLTGFEDRGAHQDPDASKRMLTLPGSPSVVVASPTSLRSAGAPRR